MTASLSWPRTFRALRHGNYRAYAAAQLISLTGSWVQTAALMWLAYTWTETSTWPALVASAQVVPMALLSVAGGWLADRFPRQRLIVLTQSAQLVQALLLVALVLADWREPAALLGISALLGIFNALDNPARLAFLIEMVGREDLANAVALNALTFNLARLIGPAIGAVLLAITGPAGCFSLNALTYVPILIVLLRMRLPETLALSRPAQRSGALGYLLARPRLLLLLAMAGAMAFFGWPLLSLLPALADQRLQAGEQGYARLLSAVGAGALVGSLLVATFTTGQARLVALAASVACATSGLVGLAWASTLTTGMLLAALAGLGLILFFASGQTAMQLGADEHNRGRVLGVWLTVLAMAHPLGHLSAGWLADRWGVPAVLWLQAGGLGGCGVVVGLLGWWMGRARGNKITTVAPIQPSPISMNDSQTLSPPK